MSEEIAFHFDPICPWAWLTSRWATRLEALGRIQIDWRLFSLGIANLPEGESPPLGPVGKSGHALALLARAKKLGGNPAIASLYTAMGTAAHVRHESLGEPEVLESVWKEAGLDRLGREAAGADKSWWDAVREDHQAAVDSCGAFGVPTLILDGGKGPGIFGPVITEVPSDEEAQELLQDLLRLTRRGYFFELKRDRQGSSPLT